GFTRNFSTTFNARFEKLSTMFNHQPSLRVEPNIKTTRTLILVVFLHLIQSLLINGNFVLFS
ncbi:hypothetical protein, partial [Arcicella rosea]|uniref:hypothetical protein n=1 Tax=Arcicella rosea TaxID=502909 RepID=UPI001C884F1C